MDKRNFSIADYRDIYGPGRTKTYELIAEGKLKTIKIGTRTFITAESAEAHRTKLLRDQADANQEERQV